MQQIKSQARKIGIETFKMKKNELIDVENDEINKGDYEYYFKLADASGVVLKYLKGKFLVKWIMTF